MVSAIFILLVLAALGAAILTFSTTQHAGATQDLEGSRALLAARAGIEWGLFKVVNGTCPNQNLTDLGGASGFTIAVACEAYAYTEDAGAHNAYKLTATACSNTSASCPSSGPDTFYVERRLELSVFP